MEDAIIRLSVPPEATFARSVRMMAANLAVLCAMNVDEVEDARMAAEEAFVYACATRPSLCEMSFSLADDALRMCFSLGEKEPEEDPQLAEQLGLARLLLEAVSDSCEFDAEGAELRVTKLVGGR